jgi:toxin ParE1/3/4
VTQPRRRWTVRLAAAAASDFENILEWTMERFGESQALVYAETLPLDIEALTEGPSIAGAKQRDEIVKGLYSLHVARHGRKGRHFVMLRTAASGDAIEILRVLHDSMDLRRHLRDEPTQP